MLINLLAARDYLLVVLILLPVSNQRSLNADHLQRTNATAADGPKSFSPLKKVYNFVDGQCPPNANNVNYSGPCRHDCSGDVDCTEDYKCCEDGCSMQCTQPWFPNRVVDWARSSSNNQILDSPELPNEDSGPWKSRGEPCSTSILDGLQPLSCPTNYVCKITMEGDLQLNIPNRGDCVRIRGRSGTSEPVHDTRDDVRPQIDTACSHKGQRYKHKEKFRKDCNICVCHNGVVFCDNQRCPVKIGIPAAISGYAEQTQMSRDDYIDIDGEEGDTDDASGSGLSISDERRREDARGTINLGDSDGEDEEMQSGDGNEGTESGNGGEEEQSGEDRGDGDGEQDVGVISGDSEEENRSDGGQEVGVISGDSEEENRSDGGQEVGVISGDSEEENRSKVSDPDEKDFESGDRDTDEENSKNDDGDGSDGQDDENNSGDRKNDDYASGDHEVNNGEDSGDKEINLQNKDLSSGDSGSATLGTEAPKTTETSTTTRQKMLTLAPEISTLALEIETVVTPTSATTAEQTTMAPKTRTLSPEISTVFPAVGDNKTTDSTSKLPDVKTTEGIIRLGKSDYEPSGGSSGDDSGDEEASSQSGSSDESSAAEVELGSQPSEQVYPRTIVLGKYVRGAKHDKEFGFETDGSRTDVQNTASLKRATNETSVRDSESRSKKPWRRHKRGSHTLEYFQTTDDEH